MIDDSRTVECIHAPKRGISSKTCCREVKMNSDI